MPANVLTGFATTSIFDVILATLFKALPCSLNIPLLTCNKSHLSIPGLRDYPPRNIPTSILLKSTSGSYPISIELTRAYAQSSSSSAKPANVLA